MPALLSKTEPEVLKAQLEQYKELCATGRNIDNKLWAVPTTAFTFEGFALQGYFQIASSFGQRLLVALLISMVFAGLTLQLARFRAYQLLTEHALERIAASRLVGLVQVNQFANLRALPPSIRAPWIVRAARISSTHYMLWTMQLVMALNLALVMHAILTWSTDT